MTHDRVSRKEQLPTIVGSNYYCIPCTQEARGKIEHAMRRHGRLKKKKTQIEYLEMKVQYLRLKTPLMGRFPWWSSGTNAVDAGSIPGWGTNIPQTAGQLSPCATARDAHTPQLRPA